MMMECTQFQRLVQIIDIRIIPLAATSSNEILPTSYIVEINHMYFAYNYGIATDFNKACVYPKGSAIFVHVKGTKTYTGGCIAFDEDRMVEILRNCDMSLVITVRE